MKYLKVVLVVCVRTKFMCHLSSNVTICRQFWKKPSNKTRSNDLDEAKCQHVHSRFFRAVIFDQNEKRKGGNFRF